MLRRLAAVSFAAALASCAVDEPCSAAAARPNRLKSGLIFDWS